MNQKLKFILPFVAVIILLVAVILTHSSQVSGSTSLKKPTPEDLSRNAEDDLQLDIGYRIKAFTSGETTYYFLPGYYSDSLQIDAADTILYGSEIPTVYLTTDTGKDYLHEEKEHESEGSVIIQDADGVIEYDGGMSIHTRGNSTWNQEKKPYQIKLDEKTDLFGLGAAKKWILISNYDESYLRNKISSEMAKALEMDFVADILWVNVYMDGEYLGLYEFAEKVEISSSRIAISELEKQNDTLNDYENAIQSVFSEYNFNDFYKTYRIKGWELNNPEDITGGYLLEYDLIWQQINEPSGFVTETLLQPVVIKSPEFASVEQVRYIKEYVDQVELLMYESVGKDTFEELAMYIDVASFVKKYLVNEVSADSDSVEASQYFYKDSSITGTGLLYAASPWDCERAWDNTGDTIWRDPQRFFLADGVGSIKMFQVLYYNKAFQEEAKAMYREVVSPYLTKLLIEDINKWQELLIASVEMDAIRWSQSSDKYLEEISKIKEYILLRQEFLDSQWRVN